MDALRILITKKPHQLAKGNDDAHPLGKQSSSPFLPVSTAWFTDRLLIAGLHSQETESFAERQKFNAE